MLRKCVIHGTYFFGLPHSFLHLSMCVNNSIPVHPVNIVEKSQVAVSLIWDQYVIITFFFYSQFLYELFLKIPAHAN